MKTILYATDCSEHSAATLHYAYALSQALNTGLTVLKVYDIPPAGTSVTRPAHSLEKYAFEEHTDKLKAFCIKHLGNELDKMNVRTEAVKHVSIIDGILEKSEEVMAGMIVVGMKHEDSHRGYLEGNIAKALITKAACPVLTVPEHTKNKTIESIVYASDFEEDDIFAIEKLTPIAKAFGSKIHVIHITTKNEYAAEDQMEWFKEMLQQKVRYENMDFAIFYSSDIYEALNDSLEKASADLLVMLEREEHGFFRKLFHRDLVKRMESHISIPLLSFNQKNL